MFPFPNATESDDPLHPLFFKSPTNFHLPNDLNPTFDDKYYNHFFSCFPNSPLFDDHDLPLNQILPNNLFMNSSDQPQPQAQPRDSDGAGVKKETPTKRGLGASSKMKGKAGDDQMMTTTVAAPPSRRRGLGAVPRRRTGKKDRHSKISTAQGIRDRRMRLSLQIARKFFDLQDMLGYDKASKTIEWLFSKSKKAIKEVIKENNPQGNSISRSDGKSESFVSECEVMSGIDQENSNSEVKEGTFPDNETFLLSSNINDVKDERKSRTKTVSKPNVRESREKARARARCRTREKLMNKGLDQSSTPWQKSSPNCNDVQKLGSSTNPFESGVVVDQAESGSINQERVSSYGADYTSTTSFGQQMADVGTIEKLLGTSASSSTSCPISDYYCSAAVPCCIDPSSSFMGFLGNWDLLNNDRDNISATVQVSLPNSEYSSSVNNNTPNFTFYHQ